MAFVLDVIKRAGTEGEASADLTFEEWFTADDSLQAGDYIMVCASNQTGVNALTLTSSTGTWQRLDNIDSPRVSTQMRSQVWWHKFDGTTLPSAPTAGGGSTSMWVAFAWVVRDAPDVADQTWIDVNARTEVSTGTRVFTIDSVTTTVPDALVLTVFTSTGSSAFETPDNFWGMDLSVGRAGDNSSVSSNIQRIIVASRAQYTAGATPTYDYVNGLSNGVRAQHWTIAIKNKTGGVKPVGIQNPPTRIFDYFDNNNFTTAASVLTDLSTIRATIDGQSTFALANIANVTTIQGLITNNPPILDWYRRISITPPTGTTGVAGVRWDLPASTDYTTGLWCLFFQRASAVTDSVNGVYHYFEDSTGNWAVYRFLSRVEGVPYNTLVRHLPDETAVDGSVTPPDLTDITKRGVAYQQTGSNTVARAFFFRAECIQPFSAPLTLTGGGADYPVTARRVARMLSSGAAWNLAFAQGQGQQVITMPYQLGDGTIATYVDDEAQALEYPRAGGVLGYTVLANRQVIRIKASASDSIILDAGIKGTSREQDIIIDPSSSTSATYGFAGTFVGWKVTGKTGVSMNNATWIGCAKIDGKGSSYDNCTFRSSIATDAALRLENGGSASGSVFTKGAETYAIEVQGTGTINIAEATFTGYTKPLNILASSGTVTIELGPDDTEPTYDTAGATVVFDQVVVQSTASVEWTQTGSSVQVYNVTTATEIYAEANISGTSWSLSYTPPTSFNVGDTVRVRIRKAGYEPIQATAVVGSTGWSVFGDQVVDSRYSSSTPANFSVDYVNEKIRATSTRNSFTAQEIVTIIRQSETTLDGIRLPIFAEVSGLVTLSAGVSTALTVKLLDNWQLSWGANSVSQATVGGGNVVGGPSDDPVEDVVDGPQVTVNLSAAATQVSVGSGVLPSDITAIASAVWDTVLANHLTAGTTGEALDDAAQGGGGGGGGGATAQQVWEYATRTLTASSDPSAATIASQVRTELSTELARIDVATSTRLATAEYTAPANSDITAIKAKTDALPADPASNTQVNTRLASASYVAPANADITAIKAKTDNLPAQPASRGEVSVVNEGVKKASLLVPHTGNLP